MAVKKPQLPKGLLEHSEEQIIKKLIEWTQLDAKGMQSFVHDLLQTVNIPVVTSAPVETVEHPPLLKLMDNGAGTRRLYAYYEDNWSYIDLVGGGGAPSDDAFGLIVVAGQTTIEADTAHDTLTIVEGRDITITTDHVNDTLTIGVSDGNMNHSHDNVYYTEGEIDAIIAGLGGTYYTETEVDTLFTNHGAAANPHTVYILHTLAAAVNDFLVASGANTFVKKTLAETGAILEGDINHDNLVGYDANDHIDHTTVSIIAGTLLTGGGTLAASRTLNVDEASINHDALTNFLATEHFTVASIDHGAIAGLADNDHTQYILHSLADAASDFLVASGDNVFAKKTLAETGAILEADIQHDNLQGIVANEHLDWTADLGATNINVANLPVLDGLDTSAIHDDTANEISALVEKVTPHNDDIVIIEDSEAAYVKKKVKASKFGGGGAAGSVTVDDATLDKFLDDFDETTDWLQDLIELIDEQAVEVIQSDAAPGTTYPGMIWVDTDASEGNYYDGEAIHENVAGEISAIAAKGTPTTADFLLIEDAAAANVKKRITIGDLPFDAEGHTHAVTLGATSVATTSGTYKDLTGISQNAVQINVFWRNLSNNNSSYAPIIQLKNQSAIQATGYDGTVCSGGGNDRSDTDGIHFCNRTSDHAASDIYDGHMIITRMNVAGTIWAWQAQSIANAESGFRNSMGYVVLTTAFGGTLRITSESGVAAFDGGAVYVSYF